MNKISKVLIVLVIATFAFTIGYKYGDSRGYTDGYNEGYRYDCREEIAALYEQVKSQKKVTEFAQQSIRNVLRENDSLKNPSYAQQRYADSVAWREQYSRDSVKNYRRANFLNDSIAAITGMRYNYYTDDGRFNPTTCIPPGMEKKVKECAKHMNFVNMFRKQKEF